MYDQILFPTDGSDGAAAALAHAQNIAENYDATLHMITVLDTTAPHIGMVTEMSEGGSSGMVAETHEPTEPGVVGEEHGVGESLIEQSQALVESAAAEATTVDTVTAVEEGKPHEAIRGYATEHDIDLIVMGTHGRTEVERYLLGSVTEKVVRTADVPVLTVRLDESGE